MKNALVLAMILNLIPAIALSQERSNLPPGTILLNDSLFIDKTPVTNSMFLEYLTAKHDLARKGFKTFAEYHKTVDQELKTLITMYPSYLKNLNSEESLLTKKKYFEKLRYNNLPVLRISKDQAKDYCKWRTEMVLYKWRNKNLNGNQKIKYRLPKKEELDFAKNHFIDLDTFKFYDGKDPTRFKAKSKVTRYSTYNISEFTASEKIFGENWKNTNPTEFPSDATGFRCICEVAAE